jgi:hypothetical protein
VDGDEDEAGWLVAMTDINEHTEHLRHLKDREACTDRQISREAKMLFMPHPDRYPVNLTAQLKCAALLAATPH